MQNKVRVLLVVLPLAFATGCGGWVGRAKKDYVQGRYLEVTESLGQHESELHDLPPRKQAEFGLYRGLALLRLGDYPGAYRWLSFAYQVERARGGALAKREREDLDRGWQELNVAMSSQLPPGTVLVPAPAGMMVPPPAASAPPSAPPPPAAPSGADAEP